MSKSSAKPSRVAVVGASGAVGRELLKILERRNFTFSKLGLFSSSKSAGQRVRVGSNEYAFEALEDSQQLESFDLAFFVAGSAVSKKFVFDVATKGVWVIDNASVFRMRDDVPLIIPEVNATALDSAQKTRVVANPNCTTAIALMAVKPLHDAFGVERLMISSYQAVSGKGAQGLRELEAQSRAWARGEPSPAPQAFSHPIAFNCIPQIDVFGDDGFTGEETKVIQESRKILGLPNLRVTATCVRVPVWNGHSESIAIETAKDVDLNLARQALSEFSGTRLCDDPAKNIYPMPILSSGSDDVYVGRLRHDPSAPYPVRSLQLWVSGDNLRKGAALNAVQIAEALRARGFCA